MSQKRKFKPEITRIKLNPEQAVLTCPGYKYDFVADFFGSFFFEACDGSKTTVSSNATFTFASAVS